MTERFESELFDDCVRQIKTAYDDLGHQLGWQFLYTPKRSFSRSAPLWFLGLNPGGGIEREPVHSFESGNAYRVDHWGGRGRGGALPGPNQLQRQITALYKTIADILGTDADNLMDNSLASNLCPFRSPSWNALPRKPETIEFSMRLWSGIIERMLPRAIVTIAPQASRGIIKALDKCGYQVTEHSKLSAGWGSVTCDRVRMHRPDRSTLIVRFPHFSRFAIVGRSESEATVHALAMEIAKAIDS